MDLLSRYFMIVGCLFGGITSAVVMTTPVFLLLMRIVFPSEKKPVAVNGNTYFKPIGEVNNGFLPQNG